ncbi:MAG TPA: hypothetical protein VGE07_05595 [Herpetosiphonaceae bacterium]
MSIDPPVFRIGERVRTTRNERRRTPRCGFIRATAWHHKGEHWMYFLAEGRKKIPTRYLASDLEPFGMPLPPDAPGTIVWLNGVSSAGKSTLARRLLPLLPASARHFDLDAFALPAGDQEAPAGRFLNPTQLAFLREIERHADAGGWAVVDYIFFDHLRALEAMGRFARRRVYFAELFCPLAELERRAAARGDRRPDQARGQFAPTYVPWRYDLRLDSSAAPLHLAGAIIDHLAAAEPAGAFAANLALVAELCDWRRPGAGTAD